MTSSPVSSLEDLNAALLNQNPFAKPPYLSANDVWGSDFFDIETINAHASDAVFQALNEIHSGLYSTTSIAITAQDGTGKTHVISRIRHRLQNQCGGLFVYANRYGDISQIKPGFQRILAQSLGKIGSQGVTQWQEIATAMTNDAMKFAKPNSQLFLAKQLFLKFNDEKPEKVKKWVRELTRAFTKAKQVSDPDIVKAIFWTLSDEQALYAIKWLEGEELAQYKSNELELPSQRQSFDAVLQILDLISEYNELTICFDELDASDAYDDTTGLHLSQIIAGLIKDLLQNLKRGVILSVMMPAQWSHKIKQLKDGVYNKVSAQGNPLELKYIDEESIINVVSYWLNKYYDSRNLVPPYPCYPFNEDKLRNISREKPTIRQLLQWCKVNCKPDIGKPILPENLVEVAFKKEIETDIGDYLDDPSLIADALLFGFSTLIGQTVERLTIEEVTDKVRKKGGKDDYINFKIIGKENEKDVIIGVAVLQYAGGRALGAGLRRLNDYDSFGLTRGCLVRSKNRKITSYIEATYLEPLIRQNGGEFVELKEEEIKSLVAIRAVHQKREVDYGVSEEQIFQFIAEKGAELLLGNHNPLIKEILSDPSYEVPTDLIEDEPIIVAESIMADLYDAEQIDEAIESLLSKID